MKLIPPTININVIGQKRWKIRRVRSIIAIAGWFGMMWLGHFMGASAVMWASFMIGVLSFIGFLVLAVKEETGLTIEEARAFLDKLEAGEQ
jgi:hypothetical protein